MLQKKFFSKALNRASSLALSAVLLAPFASSESWAMEEPKKVSSPRQKKPEFFEKSSFSTKCPNEIIKLMKDKNPGKNVIIGNGALMFVLDMAAATIHPSDTKAQQEMKNFVRYSFSTQELEELNERNIKHQEISDTFITQLLKDKFSILQNDIEKFKEKINLQKIESNNKTIENYKERVIDINRSIKNNYEFVVGYHEKSFLKSLGYLPIFTAERNKILKKWTDAICMKGDVEDGRKKYKTLNDEEKKLKIEELKENIKKYKKQLEPYSKKLREVQKKYKEAIEKCKEVPEIKIDISFIKDLYKTESESGDTESLKKTKELMDEHDGLLETWITENEGGKSEQASLTTSMYAEDYKDGGDSPFRMKLGMFAQENFLNHMSKFIQNTFGEKSELEAKTLNAFLETENALSEDDVSGAKFVILALMEGHGSWSPHLSVGSYPHSFSFTEKRSEEMKHVEFKIKEPEGSIYSYQNNYHIISLLSYSGRAYMTFKMIDKSGDAEKLYTPEPLTDSELLEHFKSGDKTKFAYDAYNKGSGLVILPEFSFKSMNKELYSILQEKLPKITFGYTAVDKDINTLLKSVTNVAEATITEKLWGFKTTATGVGVSKCMSESSKPSWKLPIDRPFSTHFSYLKDGRWPVTVISGIINDPTATN